jgi:hypothetical protein
VIRDENSDLKEDEIMVMEGFEESINVLKKALI